VSTSKKLICRSFIIVGNSLTIIGCVGLMLGLLGLVSIEFFAMGLSSGMRIVGSVAITGCLLSAIGYGVVDYLDN
jgi:hypothetical protein